MAVRDLPMPTLPPTGRTDSEGTPCDGLAHWRASAPNRIRTDRARTNTGWGLRCYRPVITIRASNGAKIRNQHRANVRPFRNMLNPSTGRESLKPSRVAGRLSGAGTRDRR